MAGVKKDGSVVRTTVARDVAAAVLASVVSIAAACESAAAERIYANPGHETLYDVRARVRRMPPEKKAGGVEVILRPGVYRSRSVDLDARDSGREGAPIVWKAEKPGTVRIATYSAIDPATFAEWRDGILVAPLPKKVNLDRITSPHWRTNEVPLINVPHLVVDGKMMTPATWPNEGWTNIAGFVDAGWRTSNGNTPISAVGPRRGGTFVYSGDRPSRWLNDRDYWLEGYWSFDWHMADIQVESINVASNTITLAAPHVYGVRPGNPSPRRWRARHVLSELDAPGEYYVDARERRLYLMPPAGFDAKKSEVSISGYEVYCFTVRNASDIRFENLTFSEGWWTLLSIGDSRRIEVKDCTFRAGHSKGISLTGSFDCRIAGCDFFDLGSGGIYTGEDDFRTLKPSGNVIEDCLFRRCSLLVLTYAPAICGRKCVGTVFRHCEITDMPHIGAVVNGNDCVYEYNVMSNVCYAADDAAGYYGGRRPDCQGNEIRHCLFRNIRSRLASAGMCGVYLDDGQMGHRIHHTLFVNAGRTSVRKNGQLGHAGAMYTNAGFSNRCENCIFVDCVQAFGCYQQTDKEWAWELGKGLKSNGKYWGLGQLGGLAFFTNEVYLAKYPYLRDYLEVYRPAAKRVNTARNNVVIDCRRRDTPAHGGWDFDETDIVLGKDEDPGFVDRAGANFALRPDSVIYRKLPGFTPIEFEKMGLLRRR